MAITILSIISKRLAEEMELKPLQEGESKEFILKRAGQVDLNSSKKTATPQAQILPGQDLIQDKYDDEGVTMKEIMNITGYKPLKRAGEKTHMEPEFEAIRFDSTGSIYLNHTDNVNKLFFMMLNNKNESNPNRIATKSIQFFEVDEDKEITLKNNVGDYRTMCGVLLLDSDHEDRLIIADRISATFPGFYPNIDKSNEQKLKATLGSIAEMNPIDFIRAVKDPKSYHRLIVDIAIAKKKIFFDDNSEKLTWNFKRSAGIGAKGKKIITKLDSKKNTVKGLVEYISSPSGSEDLMELKQFYEENY